MSDLSEFISRTGVAQVTPEKMHAFASDFTRFGKLIPEGTVGSWEAETSGCSFEVSPLGKVSVSITESKPFSLLKYEGVAGSIPFRVWLQLADGGDGSTKFRIVLRASLNPFFKMMASGAIDQYLSGLVDEIEKFDGWNTII